jgi:hypothetical protein
VTRRSGRGSFVKMQNGGGPGAIRPVATKRPGGIRRPSSPSPANVSPAKPPTGGGAAVRTMHGRGFTKRSTPLGTIPKRLPAAPRQIPGVAAPKPTI